MKRQFYNYGWLFILFFSGIACEPEEVSYEQAILGVWFIHSEVADSTGLVYRNELIFRQDDTYEQSLQLVNTADSVHVTGYLSLETGKYKLRGNRLSRLNVKQYGLDNQHSYLDWGDLLLYTATEVLPEVSLEINKSGSVLTIDYLPGEACPDLADCLEFATYYRSGFVL